MRGRGLVAPLLLALIGGSGAEIHGQAPTGAVDVEITVDDAGRARVEERYLITPAPPSIELQALTRTCAEVGGVSLERDGAGRTVVTDLEDPWLVFRDTTAMGGDTLRLVVRYEVALSARHADVPLLHLTAPIPQRDGEREGTVQVVVRFADASGRVRFPHLTRQAPAEWGARFVAIPSFVEVSTGGAEPGMAAQCATSFAAVGDDGGLVWRFFLFVGIMAAWVPLYLWWAGRPREGDE